MDIPMLAWAGPWLKPILIFLAAAIAGFLAPAVLLRPLAGFFEKVEPQMKEVLYAAGRRHIPFWFTLAGIVVGLRLSPLRGLHPLWIRHIDHLLMVLFVLSVSLAIARIAVVWIHSVATRLALGTTTLLENLTRLVIYGMGLLLILANLDISIAPLLTALGVGSLAVALALQDTLSN